MILLFTSKEDVRHFSGFFLPQHNLITTRLTRRSLSDTLGEQYSLVVSKVLGGFLSHLTLLVILMGLDKSEA